MKKVCKAVIIDDEESAIENLQLELQRYDSISVVGTARTGSMGMKLVEKVRPDLVFQDVELPDMLGFDLVARLRDRVTWNMDVVFYTAYDKYIINALREQAFDFLLKPVDSEELKIVVERYGEHIRTEGNLKQVMQEETDRPFMVMTPTGDLRFLRASEIGYFHYLSNRKIWEVALANGTFIPLRRSTTAEQLCAHDTGFIQIHQSYIINMRYLIMVQDNRCIMYPPFDKVDELQVSKKFKKEMMERFFQF